MTMTRTLASFVRHSEIAQLAEQLTVNQRVAGSSPALGAKNNPHFDLPAAR